MDTSKQSIRVPCLGWRQARRVLLLQPSTSPAVPDAHHHRLSGPTDQGDQHAARWLDTSSCMRNFLLADSVPRFRPPLTSRLKT